MKTVLSTFLLFLGLTGSCSDGAQAPDSPGSAEGAGVNLTRPTVNVSQISITSMSFVNKNDNGVLKVRATFQGAGDLDYIKYKACSKTTFECIEGESKGTQVLLPPVAQEGKASIEAWPCVDAERSITGVSCGDSKQDEYTQPKTLNNEIILLSSLRQKKLNSLLTYGERIKQIVIEFDKDIEQCKDDTEEYQKLMGIRQTTKGFVALGDALIKVAVAKKSSKGQGQISDAANESLISNAGEQINKNGAKPALEQVKTGATSLQKFNSYADTTKTIFTKIGYYDNSPVNAIQGVGNVVLDLFTAKDAVKPGCFAEENARREMGAAKSAIDTLKTEIQELDDEIKAAGGSL